MKERKYIVESGWFPGKYHRDWWHVTRHIDNAARFTPSEILELCVVLPRVDLIDAETMERVDRKHWKTGLFRDIYAVAFEGEIYVSVGCQCGTLDEMISKAHELAEEHELEDLEKYLDYEPAIREYFKQPKKESNYETEKNN